MDYSNPEIPGGINTSKQHPLKDFFLLSIGVLGGIAVCIFILSLFVEKLAVYIPFQYEQTLLEKTEFKLFADPDSEAQTYLNELTAQLLPHLELPEAIKVDVNYVNEPIQNAFASLGGQIAIYQGLIDLLPNENALAMVIAHEIAHIKHRDPIVALGRGVTIGLFLSAIVGTNSNALIGNVITETGHLTILNFNRDQERHADTAALKAVAAHYGHINGADALFKKLMQLEDKGTLIVPEFLSTHPLSQARINAIHEHAQQNGWSPAGATTPLPTFLKAKPEKSD